MDSDNARGQRYTVQQYSDEYVALIHPDGQTLCETSPAEGHYLADALNDRDALAARLAQAETERDKAYRAINWACGCGPGNFEPPIDQTSRPYWWRSHLAARAGLAYDPENMHYCRYDSCPNAQPAPSTAEQIITELAAEHAPLLDALAHDDPARLAPSTAECATCPECGANPWPGFGHFCHCGTGQTAPTPEVK